MSDLGVTILRDGGISATTARERIRLYLIMYVGETIDGEELQVVGGIAEFARRIRELRTECGYHIASGSSPDPQSGIDLKPDQYMMVKVAADTDAARRWHVANRIRRSPGGAKSKLLRFLQENVGQIVTTEELSYVAKSAKEFARRSRELRTEDGYALATRFSGRPDLSAGEYILESIDRVAEPHDRKILLEIAKAVYDRDRNACVCCGWNRQTANSNSPRILELHHLDAHADRGANSYENLAVLCSRCHDDVHAGRRTVTRAGDGFKCSDTDITG